jgi:hypothetical protein
MPAPDVRAHIASLVGSEIRTITGSRNEVLRIEGDELHERPSAKFYGEKT